MALQFNGKFATSCNPSSISTLNLLLVLAALENRRKQYAEDELWEGSRKYIVTLVTGG